MPYDGTKVRAEDRRLKTADVDIGEATYYPGGVCGPRVQRDFQLIILSSGNCRVIVNEAAYDLTVGIVYKFLPGGSEYFAFSPDYESHHFWCAASPRCLPASLQQSLCQAPFAVAGTEAFRMLLTGALKLHRPRTPAMKSFVVQLAISLFHGFLAAAEDTGLPAEMDPAVRLFLNHVEDHYGQADCLESAQIAAGISQNTLIQRVHRELRITPGRYLWNFRVERGIELLQETGLSAAEIAFRCGFSDPAHFSRLVQSHTGRPPSQLRQKAPSLNGARGGVKKHPGRRKLASPPVRSR